MPDHLAGQAMGGGGRSARAVARQARRDIAGVEAVAGRHRIDWAEEVPGGEASLWGPIVYLLAAAALAVRTRQKERAVLP